MAFKDREYVVLMRYSTSHACHEENLYLAGRIVAPGVYQRLSDRRKVILEEFDYLPASLDGQVACYIRLTPSAGDALADPMESGKKRLSTSE